MRFRRNEGLYSKENALLMVGMGVGVLLFLLEVTKGVLLGYLRRKKAAESGIAAYICSAIDVR